MESRLAVPPDPFVGARHSGAQIPMARMNAAKIAADTKHKTRTATDRSCLKASGTLPDSFFTSSARPSTAIKVDETVPHYVSS
jgi:hypothetical protein